MSVLVLLFAATLASGNAEFEQATVDGAADIALARLDAQVAEKGLATNFLERTMLADPASHRTCAESEALCRTLYRSELERSYRAKTSAILRELGSDRAPTEPDAKLLDAAADRHFGPAFKADRAAACAVQAAGIALKVKPDEADLESKGEDEARTWLTGRIAGARELPVFEENLRYISEKIVDPLLADARKERKRQQEYLMRTRSDACAPEVLAKEIEANLRKNVAERNAKCDDPLRAWNVFPRTLRVALTNAVERRLLAIVEREVKSVPFAIDTNAVRETIVADPAAHRGAKASEGIFREEFARDLLANAYTKAEQSAPTTEREAFGEYVRARSDAPVLAEAVDARLKRDTLPKWRQFRAVLAKAEADRLWPTLSDRTWFPEAELADRIVASSDYAAAVKAWREVPELGSLAKASGDKPPLEETAADADKSVSAAFDLARNAISAQKTIVGEVSPGILAAAKDPSKGVFTTTPELAEVIDALTKGVEGSWDEKRLKTLWPTDDRPANAEEQHKALFPSVRREIELEARRILEEMKKAEPAPEQKPQPTAEQKPQPNPEQKPKPEDPPPEEKPPEEKPPEEEQSQEEPLEMISIVVKRVGGRVTVTLKRGSETV